MKKRLILLFVALVSLAVAFAIAELIWRTVRPDGSKTATSPPDVAERDLADLPPRMYYRSADGTPMATDEHGNLALEELAKIFYFLDGSVGLPAGEKQVPVPPAGRPQPPHAFRPGAHFYICYTGPQQPYFDENGGVEYRFNSVGLREEDDITFAPKPADQYRILCLGDSFTLGWGVRAEDNWTTLLEQDLQRDDPNVRTVNTGMAGQSYADEYWFALRDRLHRLQPDMVLVNLCLNDLIITNYKLGHVRSRSLVASARDPADVPWWEHSAILSDLARSLDGDRFALDSDIDHVRELIGLPDDHQYYKNTGESAELFWGAGTPQNSLRAMRDWCKERDIPFGVVIWPLFQNLEHGDNYPFETLHSMVVEFCSNEGIKSVDLLPAFRGEPAQELWVSPIDTHGNAHAMTLAAPAIAAFARALGNL